MRDILLKNQSLYQKAGSSTLPALINLVQYNAVGKQAKTLAEYKGTFGDNNFAFAIDVPELGVSDSSPFKVLSSMFKDSRYPTISKKHLDTMFYIFEIPDYGHQALSAFYQDFMVMIFNSSTGLKIPQKYIGHIRAYHNKKMYIIIDKEYKIKEDDSFDIRVIFKSGVDKVDSISIELELEDSPNDTDVIFSKTFKKEEFPFTGKDITAFDVFIKKGDKLLRFVNTFNPDLFKITFDEDPKGGKVIIHTQSQYFRDLYKTDFDESKSIPELSEESIEVKVSTLNLTGCSIVLKTPHAAPEYLLKMNEEFFNTDYLAFNNSGKLLMNDISDASEFIPIFNKSRLIILYGTKPNTQNWINQWLYNNKDIRYNMLLEERDYIYFNDNDGNDVVYIFDNALPVNEGLSISGELDCTNMSVRYHELSEDEQKITVINDPYYVINDLNDLTTGALHIIDPGKVEDERDITKELVDGSEMKPYNNIQTELTEGLVDDSETEPYNNIEAYLADVIDGFSEYKYVASEFLENFLKNSIKVQSDFDNLEKIEDYTKIFVIKMNSEYEKLNTGRGTEIIKGIIKIEDNGAFYYYGITDSCPTKSDDSIYRSLF